MTDTKYSPDEKPEEKDIDIIEIIQKLWAQRRKLVKWCAIGAVVGLVIAFSIPREYVSSVKLAPEIQDSKASSSLGALASMAGIQTGGGSGQDAVYPGLYPDVVNSVPFITSLFDVKVKTSEEAQAMTVQEYVKNDMRKPWWSSIFGLPGKIIGLFHTSKDENPNHKLDNFHLTVTEAEIVKALRESSSTDYDMKTSVVCITVKMQNPLVAALLADTVVARLQSYITDYRTNKARQDLAYAMQLEKEARQTYYEAQQKLADYLDHNQYLATQSAQLTRERLQNEASLAFSLYNQTAQQVQKAQARVQETTPVYAIVEPATVPVKPTSPRRAVILIGFTFLAFTACAAWIIFLQPMIDKLKNGEQKNAD
ncbi:MAG: chain-length determining protein [Muribaculaceae bacterium]|nr:chain-length determining protein [Muribaculaceae bacterium]